MTSYVPPSRFDRIIISVVIGLTAPVWIPLWIWDILWTSLREYRILRGSVADAWPRCRQIWLDAGQVHGEVIGPNFQPSFEARLARTFARKHPDAKSFVFDRLSDSEPLIVAYALEVLLGFGPMHIEDFPQTVRSSQAEITTINYCFGENTTIARHLEDILERSRFSAKTL